MTGDSASMLTEACSTGKRTWIVELPEYRTPKARVKIAIRSAAIDIAPDLPRHGFVRYPRDLKRLHAALVAHNRARPLGQPFTAPPPPPLDETEKAAARVRALFD